MGLFDKLKQGLKKTTQFLNTDVRDLFKAEGRFVDDVFLDELRAKLFKTDMGYDAVEQIVTQIATDFRARVVTIEQTLETIKKNLLELLAQPEAPIKFAESGPTVIMVCGVNGSGKTTTISKLTYLLKSQGKKVILGAGDTFRAAAVEQLTIWSDRLGVPIVKGAPNAHPASVAYQAVEQAIKTGADVCIVDTAGRLQTQKNLMAELTKIQDAIRKSLSENRRGLAHFAESSEQNVPVPLSADGSQIGSKQLPAAPHEVILVLDATTGQNGISQAIKFTEAVNCTGIVLAKLDGTAKGGVVVAIRQQVGLPVKYIGVGEKAEDLAPFSPEEFVRALFDEVTGEPPRSA